MAALSERARATEPVRRPRFGEKTVELGLLGVALTSTAVLALIALFIFIVSVISFRLSRERE